MNVSENQLASLFLICVKNIWWFLDTSLIFFQQFTSLIIILYYFNIFKIFYKFCLKLTDLEKRQKSYRFKITKGTSIAVINITEILKILLCTGSIQVSLHRILQCFITFPILLIYCIILTKYKISTSSETKYKKFISYIELGFWIVFELIEIIHIFELLIVQVGKDDEGNFLTVIFFMVQTITLIFWILPNQIREITVLEDTFEHEHENDKFEENQETEEESQLISLEEIYENFYEFRKYFIPNTKLERFYLVIFLGVIGLDSIATFYHSIFWRRILESINLEKNGMNAEAISNDTSTAKEHNSYKFKLEFRWDLVVIYCGIGFIQGSLCSVVKYALRVQVQNACCRKLQIDIFTKLHALSLRWHLENKSNEVFSLISDAPEILSDILSSLSWTAPFILQLFLTIGYLIINYNWKLSCIVLIVSFFSVIFDLSVLGWREKSMRKMDEASNETRSVCEASFENFETVKLFTNEKYEIEKFSETFQSEQKKDWEITLFYDLFSILREIGQSIPELGLLIVVLHSIVEQQGLTTGDFIYFSTLFSNVTSPFELLIHFYRGLKDHTVLLKKVLKVLNEIPEVRDLPNATNLQTESTGNSVEFRSVDFSYVPERKILSQINLTIKPGQTVAFVGQSGSGKSTIAKLLFRFYDPTAGEILINGKNIKELKCESVRQAIGIVPQDVVLFDDTIKENIKYGKIKCENKDEIINAAKAACLHEKIASFPDKYETKVGSRGLKLSGGEKQRVAIARTILKNPPIIILDEATSSLDTETEKDIQKSLENLCESRTTIVIAHRLSTIVHANQIFVLKDGSIAESGTHNDLILQEGIYYSMWIKQFNNPNENLNNLEENCQSSKDGKLGKTSLKNDKLNIISNSAYQELDANLRRQIFSSRFKRSVLTMALRRAFSCV